MSAWLTVAEAAAELGGVSLQLVYKLFHRGEIEGAKIAGTIRLRAASVRAYLDAHSNRADAQPEEPEEAEAVSPPRTTGRKRDDFTRYYHRIMDEIQRKARRRRR